MPRFLEEELETLTEEEELETLTEEEEVFEAGRFAPTERPPDLSDAGMVNGVWVRPSKDKTVTKGRANARMVFMYNGTPSAIQIAYKPDGRENDQGRYYLRKRFCVCCHYAGFQKNKCPVCVKSECPNCGASSDRTKVIPLFYLRRELAPFAVKFYGTIPCFDPTCTRTGDNGFLTDEAMRIHAATRHKLEYQAYLESSRAAKADEIDVLRGRIDTLMASMAQKALESSGTASNGESQRKPRTKAQQEAAQRLGARSRARAEERRTQIIAANQVSTS